MSSRPRQGARCAARDAAGTQLEDDAAAAHAGATRDADAASAALHAHQATQIVPTPTATAWRCGLPWNAVGLTR